jgi:Flagellar biosynthesis protein, FliO
VKSSTVASPVPTPKSDRTVFGPILGLFHRTLSAVWKGSIGKVASRRERRLRLCETVSLGERRFVALIQFDDQPLLVGVTGNSITLLTQPASCGPAATSASDFRGRLRVSGVPER